MVYWCKDVLIACRLSKFDYHYRSIPGKQPLPGKHPCTKFQGVNAATSIQIFIPSNCRIIPRLYE